jgi:hypothetical protein
METTTTETPAEDPYHLITYATQNGQAVISAGSKTFLGAMTNFFQLMLKLKLRGNFFT